MFRVSIAGSAEVTPLTAEDVSDFRDQRAEADYEKRRIAAEERAKMDAAEAARQEQLAAQWKKREAQQQAKHAAERRKIRANCTVIYQNTIDKKVKELTVREEEQVRACQVLGLYPPR